MRLAVKVICAEVNYFLGGAVVDYPTGTNNEVMYSTTDLAQEMCMEQDYMEKAGLVKGDNIVIGYFDKGGEGEGLQFAVKEDSLDKDKLIRVMDSSKVAQDVYSWLEQQFGDKVVLASY